MPISSSGQAICGEKMETTIDATKYIGENTKVDDDKPFTLSDGTVFKLIADAPKEAAVLVLKLSPSQKSKEELEKGMFVTLTLRENIGSPEVNYPFTDKAPEVRVKIIS